MSDKSRKDSSATVIAMPVTSVGRTDRAYLVVLSGPQIGQMYRLETGSALVIGREEGATIRLSDDGISRRHAEVRMLDSGVLIQDLGSRNGTFVNAERITEHHLQEGDKIQVGVSTTLKFTVTDDVEEAYQRRLVEAALRDALTGLYNRRHFDERLLAELAAAQRHATPLALLLIDVDHFKMINDTLGHLAGDAVLKALAQTVEDVVRKEDLLARYGGEEFVVISRQTDAEGARVLGERIRHAVEESPIEWEGRPVPITVSIGTTQLIKGQTPQEIIDAADRCLYEAKRQGRNKVIQG